jgi:hypothetical protein
MPKAECVWDEKKKTDEGYDPTQKYCLVWDVTTHIMNQLIHKGGLDLILDETTWPNSSYADIQGHLQGKKTNKGGQHVLLLDSKRQYIYAWTPCHKFFEVVRPFMATGPAEVKRLVDIITPLVVGATKDPTDNRKQLFSKCVHITMDNLFSGDEVLRCYLGGGRLERNYDLQTRPPTLICTKKILQLHQGSTSQCKIQSGTI